jgi:hypothetical protein
MIVCPSRELARQTFEVINGYTASLRQDGHPELRSLLVMGGVDMKTQVRRSILPCIWHTQRALLGEQGATAPGPLLLLCPCMAAAEPLGRWLDTDSREVD